MMSTSAHESDPLLLRSDAPSSTTSTSTAPRTYGGFEQQKRAWASTAQRSQRLRAIAGPQLLLGLLACGNYLWLSNILMAVVGGVGWVAGRSERTSWVVVVRLVHCWGPIFDEKDAFAHALVVLLCGCCCCCCCCCYCCCDCRDDMAMTILQYLLLSAMEFARIVLLTPHLHERFDVPGVAFTRYEMFQVVVLVLEEVVFVVRSCCLVLWVAALQVGRLGGCCLMEFLAFRV